MKNNGHSAFNDSVFTKDGIYNRNPNLCGGKSDVNTRFGFAALFLIMVMLFQPACASVQNDWEAPVPEKELLWPSPPKKTRIKFIRSISTQSDIRIKEKKGWLGKTFDFITGGSGKEGLDITIPYGLYFDQLRSDLYVADRGLRGIHRYNLKKGTTDFIGAAGDTDFEMPVAVYVAENRLYVSDTGLNKVFILDMDGDLIRTIEGWSRPGGIAYDRRYKLIYIVDALAAQVKAFDTDGNLLFVFGRNGSGEGEFHLPSNIWIDRESKIYVADSMNFRVQVFDDRGNYIRAIGKLGDGPGDFTRPRGVAVDSDWHIYVVDADFDNVQIFDQEGKLLLFFGTSGSDKGEFTLPSGIYIDGNDRIYISDSYNKRIQVFQYLKDN